MVSIKVSSGTPDDVIVDMALRNIANYRFPIASPAPSALRVIWFYNLAASKPPLVIINSSERQSDETYSKISAAARTLTDDYGLRVLVDGNFR